MPHALAMAVEGLTTVMAVAGIGYFVAALLAAYVFLGKRQPAGADFAPGVSILKSLKGLDPGMLDAFRSHCRQSYAGEYELLFGVSALDDPAAAAVEQLRGEFPERAIRLVVCPERLGTNGKISTLVQLAGHARFEYLLINDSDITVGEHYLRRVIGCFGAGGDSSGAKEAAETGLDQSEVSQEHASGAKARVDSASYLPGMNPRPTARTSSSAADGVHNDPSVPGVQGKDRTRLLRPVGLVTALYRGRAHGTVASQMEALGIATDFHPSVLLSRWLEGGLRYGLGSTLAVSREALEAMGGLVTLVDHLADDYELGARVYAAGYAVALSREPVETSVPAYGWRGFVDHQLRWYRTVRDARPGGYVGLVVTHGLGWALLNLVASGLSPLSLWIAGMSFFLRLTLAMTVGAQVLRDHQVLPNLWLLPLRDLVAMGMWVAGFAGNTIVWRGERFTVRDGKLSKA